MSAHEIIPFACSKVFTYQVKVAGLILVSSASARHALRAIRHARLKGREKNEKDKFYTFQSFIYSQMHMFFYMPATLVGQSSLQQPFILHVRMGNGMS